MTWTNPLDRVPQIPQAWANHISQGGIWNCALLAAMSIVGAATGHEITSSLFFSLSVYSADAMTAVSVSKKIVDRFKEGESLAMCVGKAVVTVLWPWSLVAVQIPYHLNH